jgi:hypothetical protein
MIATSHRGWFSGNSHGWKAQTASGINGQVVSATDSTLPMNVPTAGLRGPDPKPLRRETDALARQRFARALDATRRTAAR